MSTHAEYTTRLEHASTRLHETATWHPHPWLRELALTKAREADQRLIDLSFTRNHQ
jgi:hypothetical protein